VLIGNLVNCCVRPYSDHTVPYEEDNDHGRSFFGFSAFPFSHDDMFRQMDEAFSNMMKNFGSFDGHSPDPEQGEMFIWYLSYIMWFLVWWFCPSTY